MSKLSNPAKLARNLDYFKVTDIYKWPCHLRDHSQKKSVVCFVFFGICFVG